MRYITGVFSLFIFFQLINPTAAQTYDVTFQNAKTQIIGAFTFWSGIQIYDMVRPAEIIHEFSDIDPTRLWRIDRNLLGLKSSGADFWSDFTLFSSIASPFLLNIFDRKVTPQGWSIFWIGLQGYFVENGINQMIKIMADRPRPSLYHQGEKILGTPITKNSTKSFFSGHASSAAYFCFFTAKIYHDTHPNSSLRPLVWALAAGLSGTTAFLRTRAGKHFYTDAACGWLFGAGMGVLIPQLYKKKNSKISLYPTFPGIHLTYTL